ncbi:Uncharacterised protein [Vibrio cholerae]|nr:Uncharacterised protein [Vibrio cholerae]CSI90488.1 Uncharacterised protein [Vibrio cholerae]
MHTQADAKVRNFVFTCILRCTDFAFDTTIAKTTRYQNRIQTIEHIGAFGFNVL